MNKTQKAYALSLIIPAYNEEDYIGVCLQSIAEQTEKPLEVIVVDNNSTDGTVEIAKKFDFVRVVKEKRQHQAFAQYSGFSIAKGDIIGRIDADSVLPKDWVSKTLAYFDDPDVVAASGSGKAYDVIFPDFGKFVFDNYFRLSSAFAGHELVWGSNCAFRKDVWPKIKNDMLLRRDIWEDYDLGFCLGGQGKICRMKDNDVMMSYRSIHKSPRQTVSYQLRAIRTFYLRRSRLITYMFAVAWSTTLLIAPAIAVEHYVLRPLKNTQLGKALISQISIMFGASN